MAITLYLNATNARHTLSDALAAYGWSGTPLTVYDMQALDLAALLSPSTRYPSGAIPQNTNYDGSSVYAVADIQAADPADLIAAIQSARIARARNAAVEA